MKVVFTVVSAAVITLGSQFAIADITSPNFRTDRLSVVKPVAISDTAVDQTRVARTDRVVFYKSDVKEAVEKREVIHRSDRIKLIKTQA